MRRFWPLFVLLLVGLVVAGAVIFSGRQAPRVRVGAKPFAENQILAHMFSAVLADAGYRVEKQIPYGNTFDLQEAIKEDKLDLYPEYTGTGLAMMGLPAESDPARSLEAVRQAFTDTGQRWLQPLGFNNSYVLVMESDQAAAMQVESISDLATVDRPLQVGCEPEFLARPLDGYQPLVRRYGLSDKMQPTPIGDRGELFRRLISGQLDVAIVNRTDPQIEAFGLNVLTDDLNFFPAYNGAPLINQAFAQRVPGAVEPIKRLANRLDAATMRQLNRRVQLEGIEPRQVAIEFLVRHGLISREAATEQRQLTVAVPDLEHRSRPVVRGLEAIHQTFTGRQVVLEAPAAPGQALGENRAFVGLIGAEHLFHIDRQKPRARADVEAIAAVGFQTLHLLRPQDQVTAAPLDDLQTLGVGPARGGSERLARILAAGYAPDRSIELRTGSRGDQAAAVAQGRLDGLLLAAPLGDAQIIQLLDTHPELTLQPITGWQSPKRQYRYPFITSARIPGDVYPRLAQPIDSVGTQMVIAAPKPAAEALGDGDPVSGLRTESVGIPLSLKQELTRRLGETEPLNPTLPGQRIQRITARKERRPLNPSPRTSIATAMLLAGVVAVLYLLVRPAPPLGRKKPDSDGRMDNGKT
jgi:glycine betaine/choline ABC-type transport system substrate-binding protein